MSEQPPLFYDDEFHALRMMIEQGKGYKATAMYLWGGMRPESAYARLKNCTRGDRDEKLSFGEILAAMNFNERFYPLYYAAQQTSHAVPLRVAPKDEQERLAGVIAGATETLRRALNQLERIGGRG